MDLSSFLFNNTEYPPTHQSILIKMLSHYRKQKESVMVVTITDTYLYQKGRKEYIFKIGMWKREKKK